MKSIQLLRRARFSWATFSLLFCLAALPVSATTYYVSPSGSNGNTGTSPSTAWQTISKVNSANLQPGDQVLFERGGVYRGQINAKAGTAGNPVVYGAYGSGNAPVISGTQTISATTGWQQHSGNIYKKTSVLMPPMTDAEPPTLLFNGKLMVTARYPNSGFLVPDSVVGAGQSSSAFYDYSLGSLFGQSSDLVGGHFTAYDPYSVGTRRITAYNPGTGRVDFQTLTNFSFVNQKKYFLQAKLAFLDEEGEWYYDAASGTLYAWFPGGGAPASSDQVEYSNTDFGVFAYQTRHVTVQDLEFKGQQIAGVYLIRADSSTVQNCTFSGAKHGVLGWGGNSPVTMNGVKVQQNTFSDMIRTGVQFRFAVKGATIENNTFARIGMHQALGQSGQADQWNDYGYWIFGTGIDCGCTQTNIRLNRMDSLGKPAIIGGGSGTVVEKNVIDNPCMNYNDCGGIMPLKNTVVDHNIIRNSYGYFLDRLYQDRGARGIYPDFHDSVTISNNTVAHTMKGIGLTNSRYQVVDGNTLYDSEFASLTMNRKDQFTTQLNNTISNNTFFNFSPHAYSVRWEVIWDWPGNPVPDVNSTFSSNRYWNPYSWYPEVRHNPADQLYDDWYDLGQWMASGRDAGSQKGWKFVGDAWQTSAYVGAERVQNGNFDNGSNSWQLGGSVTMNIVSGVITGNTAEISYPGIYEGWVQNSLSGTFMKDSLYEVSLSHLAQASSDGERLILFLTDASGNILYERNFKSSLGLENVKFTFRPASSISQVKLKILAPAGTHYLDNVSIRLVNATWHDPAQQFPIFINDTDLPLTIPLTDCYLSLDSLPVSGSITLQPFSSQILVLDSCATTALSPGQIPFPAMSLHPNPASDKAVLHLDLPQRNAVDVSLRDASGRMVRAYFQGEMPAGRNELPLVLGGLPGGIYLVTARIGNEMLTRRLLVL